MSDVIGAAYKGTVWALLLSLAFAVGFALVSGVVRLMGAFKLASMKHAVSGVFHGAAAG